MIRQHARALADDAPVASPVEMGAQCPDEAGAGEPDGIAREGLSQVIRRSCANLHAVDPERIESLISAAAHRPSADDPEERALHAAASLIPAEPEYAQVAARLLTSCIDSQVLSLGIHSFAQSIRHAFDAGLVNERVWQFVAEHDDELNSAIDVGRTDLLDYFGLQTLYDHYLLKDRRRQLALETPQYFWMRIAVAMSATVKDAIRLYRLFSTLDYVPSAPMLLSAGTTHEQLSSCFLLNSADAPAATGDLDAMWPDARSGDAAPAKTVEQAAGIGFGVSWLAVPDAFGREQGGWSVEDRGAACLYLEPWHVDIEDFLEAGASGAAGCMRQLNLANWIPDLFMRRVELDEQWSLFDPADVPRLPDLFGEEFDAAYREAEAHGLARKVIAARDLYARMMHTIAYTGSGWMTFKDKANLACNQTAKSGNTVHLSSLCTEVLEVTSPGDTAVCNLGSINLARHVSEKGFDFQKLAQTVRIAVRQLDRVIDLNAYPRSASYTTNQQWRPVGLGVMGLQDVFFRLRLPFDSYDARQLSTRISETIYFHALQTSMKMACESVPHEGFGDTRAARGELQFDAWGVTPSSAFRWQELRDDIRSHGLRNSLLIAIAPTATIAAIAGCHECIEPQVSNLTTRKTAHGDYVEFNRYLIAELNQLGLWDQRIRDAIVLADGSIQGLYEIPEQVRTVFRTAWELSTLALIDLAADRGAFVDQSQALNLFVSDPNVGQLSRMYMYAWQCGLKTTYSLRSRWPRAVLDELNEQEALAIIGLSAPAVQATAS